MPTEVDRLVVALEGDFSKLLEDAAKGVKLTEAELKKLEQAQKRLEREAVKATRAQIAEHRTVLRLTKQLDKDLGLIPGKYKEIGNASQGALSKLKTFGIGVVAALTAALAVLIAGVQQAGELIEKAIGGVRTRRAFFQLAANAGQSGEAILAAMTKASAGTVNEIELMTAAVDAFRAGLAATPEEFEKFTQAAIRLGRAKGLSPQEALSRLAGGVARKEIELLDELGLTAALVNSEMEALAQRDFQKSVSGLTAIERESLFAEAALNAATAAADALGGEVEDIGTSFEATQAAIQNLEQDGGEALLILANRAITVAGKMTEAFFGPDGVFPLFQEGASIIQLTAAAIVASIGAAAAVVAQTVSKAKAVMGGDFEAVKFFSGPGLMEQYMKNFTQSFAKQVESFPEIFDPAGAVSPIAPAGPTGTTDTGGSEDAGKFLLDAHGDLIDLQRRLNQETEEAAADHTEKMTEIQQEAAQARVKAAEKLTEELAELEQETEETRNKIITAARQELAALERETDKQLEQERDQFNTDERRETEDHLREMRRLRNQYLFDLEDAVKNRDARAIVDLRRRFQLERAERTQDFQVKQSRDREDQSIRLAEIRQQEAERAAEIIRNREAELQQLMAQEAEKRAELQASYAEQINQLNLAESEKLSKEQESYAERQAELDAAMSERLKLLAERLAEEDKITGEGAKAILKTLAKTFGEGGEIDELMEAYRNRLQTKMQIKIEFEGGDLPSVTGSGGDSSGGQGGNFNVPMKSFAKGGSILATKPTVALFGEAGPEMANFIPLRQMEQAMSERTINLNLKLELSGSAPPGINSADRDAIAQTLVSAFREAGIAVRPGSR